MNLIRNHIIFYKKQCEEYLSESEYPSQYHRETPEEVSNKYMAKEEEIKKIAIKTLAEYKKDGNYIYLLNVINNLNEEQKKNTKIKRFIGYVYNLERAIIEKNTIDMRRCSDLEFLKKELETCRLQVESIVAEKETTTLDNEPVQLSIF